MDHSLSKQTPVELYSLKNMVGQSDILGKRAFAHAGTWEVAAAASDLAFDLAWSLAGDPAFGPAWDPAWDLSWSLVPESIRERFRDRLRSPCPLDNLRTRVDMVLLVVYLDGPVAVCHRR